MASNLSFVEDTDEDFFDKLVNDDDDDDYKPPALSSKEESRTVDGNDAGDAKAFANLSISDVGTGVADLGKVGLGEEEIKDGSSVNNDPNEESASIAHTEPSALASSSPFTLSSVNEEPDNGAIRLEEPLDSTESENQNHGTGGAAGVKQVQWGDFGSGSWENSRDAFGSYPDFFDELGDGSIDQIGKEDNVVNSESNSVADNSFQVKDVNDCSQQVQSDQAGVVTEEQKTDSSDPSSSQYWENLYPGWRYDANTGQCYQVDESYNETSSYAQGVRNTGSASDWTASNQKSEVSYLQQSAQSVVGSVAETGKSESVTNWNSVSQSSHNNVGLSNWKQGSEVINKTYPSHMVFDPQYPGWYYDTNAQGWYSLDDYNSQSSVVAQDAVNQNGFAPTNTYYNSDQKTYSGQKENYNQNGSFSNAEQGSTMWKPNVAANSAPVKEFGNNQHVANHYGSSFHVDNHVKLQQSCDYAGITTHANGSFSNAEQDSTMWKPNVAANSAHIEEFSSNQHVANHYGSSFHVDNHVNQQQSYGYAGTTAHANGSFSNAEQGSTMWKPNAATNSAPIEQFSNNQHVANHYGSSFHVDNTDNQQQFYDYAGTTAHANNGFPAFFGSQSFVPYSQPFSPPFEQSETMNGQMAYGHQNQLSYSQLPVQSGHQISYASSAGRSSAGRPPHALVTFGFGGKLIVMKDSNALKNSSYGGQDANSGSISVHSLAEVVNGGAGVHDYFHTLCQHSFPGPLSSGNVGGKELNKWIDDKITHTEPSDVDHNKGGVLRLLLSLLKIASQHYGKLRSPFGSDLGLKENDAPEVAVARLFASVKSHAEYNSSGAFAHCLQQVPSEGQTQETAAEVQSLLVSGRKKEALLRAQEGQLWGPALVLSAQLGDQFYVDTAKKMALSQLIPGSPLRTLCLLIAGQPADVFASDVTSDGGIPGAVNVSQQPTQAQNSVNNMLDDWEDNLAVITANRTKDDELVLIHLGDCLWKERSNIIAAHICYLVAEANFEPYSDTARMCLIGADHWKHPRTYASPEAIQRTEVYEYSKLLGNSQFTLLPFQPYKLIYAHMLAEVGRVSDSLKYCQAVTKSLKTGRIPEVETWRQLVTSLEDRLKIHQQGGFSTNLAPGKIVGKLLNLFDSTAHRVVGGTPPPVPPTSGGSAQNDSNQQPQKGLRFITSQSTMAMSSLMTSPSMESINQADGNRRMIHNRSASEPDFGRPSKQDQDDTLKENSVDSQRKASGNTSRFGRFGFGSGIIQKTVSMVLKPRQDKQAKLGDTNKFYYDEKLKRWVEEGIDSPAEEAALPPPPTMATLQNGSPDYSLKTALRTESMSSGSSEFVSPTSTSHTSGIPLIPPTTNQFSARGRMGVRARYVDTFNQGGGNHTNIYKSPSVPIIKPKTSPNPNPSFFVPTAVPAPEEPAANIAPDNLQLHTFDNQTPLLSSMPDQSAMGIQKFASMDDMSKEGSSLSTSTSTSSFVYDPVSRRTASWSGSVNQDLPGSAKNGELKPAGSMPGYTFMPNETGFTQSSNDDHLEVEL